MVIRMECKSQQPALVINWIERHNLTCEVKERRGQCISIFIDDPDLSYLIYHEQSFIISLFTLTVPEVISTASVFFGKCYNSDRRNKILRDQLDVNLFIVAMI